MRKVGGGHSEGWDGDQVAVVFREVVGEGISVPWRLTETFLGSGKRLHNDADQGTEIGQRAEIPPPLFLFLFLFLLYTAAPHHLPSTTLATLPSPPSRFAFLHYYTRPVLVGPHTSYPIPSQAIASSRLTKPCTYLPSPEPPSPRTPPSPP